MKINEIPLEILISVRQRLGSDGEKDTSFDKQIEKMSPYTLMKKWSGWKLGNEDWAEIIIDNYNKLIDKEEALYS